MDQILIELAKFLNVQMLFFALIVYFLVLGQRKLVEIAFPVWSTSKWWKELLLPLGPLGTGGILAFLISKYPFPEIFANSTSGRVICGMICGMCSGLAYKIFKKFIIDKFGSNAENILPD